MNQKLFLLLVLMALLGEHNKALAEFGSESRSGFAAFWGYATINEQIGGKGLFIVDNDGRTEIIFDCEIEPYAVWSWQALTHDPTYAIPYRHIHSAPIRQSFPAIMGIGDVIADDRPEIVIVSNGHVDIIDLATKESVASFDFPFNCKISGIAFGDFDSDSKSEIVILESRNHPQLTPNLRIFRSDGSLVWSQPVSYDENFYSQHRVAVAQMDDDPGLEIATTMGEIFDFDTRSLQWNVGMKTGDIDAVDVDGDSKAELIFAQRAYDVDLQLEKWDISALVGYAEKFKVANIDNDPAYEFVSVGSSRFMLTQSIDLGTLTREWSFTPPQFGCTNVAIGDVDGDGDLELLWGDNEITTGPDSLRVYDLNTRTEQWPNPHLNPSFTAPRTGDLDGDGIDEIVVASQKSRGSRNGKLLVFDAETLRLRALSNQIDSSIGTNGIENLDLADVDNDGDMEIIVSSEDFYDPRISVFDFTPSNQFNLFWSRKVENADRYVACRAADLDLNGSIEIVTVDSGPFVIRVIPYGASQEAWSLNLGFSEVTWLELANVDDDPQLEIIAIRNNSFLTPQANDGIYVIDSISHAVQQIIPGFFTGLAVLDGAIVAGNRNHVSVYRFDSGAWTLAEHPFVYPVNPADFEDYIHGITPTSLNPFEGWVSNRGTLRYFYNGYITVTSPNFGFDFGREAKYLPALDAFIAANSNAILAFNGTLHAAPPVILEHPAPLTVNTGAGASLSVRAEADGHLAFQWYRNNEPVDDATSSTLAFTPARAVDSGSYYCRVSNHIASVDSNSATLTVEGPPEIVGHPASQSVTLNQIVTFEVEAVGTPLPVYQWKKNNAAISGETSPILVISPALETDEAIYTCFVSNSLGSTESDPASLTVNSPNTVWVDFLTTNLELGTQANPYKTLATALARVENGGLININPGATGEIIRINRAVKLSAPGGPVRIGQ